MERRKPLKRTALKRTPPKRKTRARGVYCTARTSGRTCRQKRHDGANLCPKHYADKLARAYVMDRDDCCRRCGSVEALQWAHVHSRRYTLIRHNALNAMALCSSCHLWQTHNPLEGECFFKEQIGQDYDDLKHWAMADEKPDYLAVIDHYLELQAL